MSLAARSLFSSKRERRLWFALVIVLAAIYATLGQAPAVVALVISILLGWLDEGIQSLLRNRVFELIDVAFNSIAATMIIGARWMLARLRKWAEDRQSGV